MTPLEKKRQELIDKINIMQNPRHKLHEIFKDRLKSIVREAISQWTCILADLEPEKDNLEKMAVDFCEQFVENNVIPEIQGKDD